MTIMTVEQRVAGAIGSLLIENAKFGFELETARLQAQELVIQLQQTQEQVSKEKERADWLEARVRLLETPTELRAAE